MGLLVETVLVFIALLGVLVLFHEFGHFIVAKLLRMKVEEFAFGMGPLIVRLFRRGGTEFNVRAVPIGGFVKIAGMEPGEESEVENGFNSRPIWQRALVIFAGPFMSLVLALIVFVMMGYVWGFASDKATNEVLVVTAGSVAEKAGLKADDVIVAVNGRRVVDGNSMTDIIHKSPGRPVTLEIERKDKKVMITAVPALSDNPVLKNPKLTKEERSKLPKKVGLLGFSPKAEIVRPGLIGSIAWGTTQTYEFIVMTVRGLFSKDIKQAGGPVMIGYATQKSVEQGPESVFFLLALLSLSLGVINLIPWPILDGGHILLLLVELIRGKKLEPERWMAVQAVGITVLVGLMVFLVGWDIWRIATKSLPQ